MSSSQTTTPIDTAKMPTDKNKESAWPAFPLEDDDFDWADEVIEKSGTLPEMESSNESISPLYGSETSIKTTSTQTTVDELFENHPYFFEELDSYTYQTAVEVSSNTIDSNELTTTYTFDPLLDPLIEMLEAWSFGDSEIITANKEKCKKESTTEFKIKIMEKDEELTKDSKEPEDIAPELTAEPIFVGDKSFIPSQDNFYEDEENFSLALEHYLTTVPRANLPHHCMHLDLTDEPVREPMPIRPLGVHENKRYRYRDRKLTVGETHITSVGFKQWMELKEEGIEIVEVPINEAERKLMKDRRLGYYRCRPSDLRRCWTIGSSP